ncbi:MAG TPA: PQQ-binding-like beta-propeller repeat protein [Solirubrobacterales bacterium]|nr:PQQ-binding-like beta-propeller repeat protein [Solirubrobacterales bacterium]
MRRPPVALGAAAIAIAFGGLAAADQVVAFTYDVPVQAKSPWPEMRRDSRNTASSPIRGRFRGGRPWAFATKRGIFSTPVIGGDDTVYVGSADHNFYALRPDGRLSWRFRTAGIIDAAGAIARHVKALGSAPITVGSGDERLYRLRTNPNLSRKRRIVWSFSPTLLPAGGQEVSWWEGNVAIGPGGTIYAGNTGGAAYAINPDGTLRWAAPRGQSVWTTPAFGQGAEAGNSFWGSVDLYAFSLDQNGRQRWQTFTPGYLTSSPALGSDGTVYVGSFDHKLYALDPDTGQIRWSFSTDAHIYSSPALADGPDGRTSAIYIASADGSVYALDPSGRLLWRYDTADPIRSSPVLGRKPRGGGHVLYVGSSNGRLYALDAATGKRRWSFDTTPRDPALRDRNDLNGSPALGRRGVYIGGEHGRIWFVPYDYCLHTSNPRCSRKPGQEFGKDVDRMFYVTPGGTTVGKRKQIEIPPATVLATRLLVRRSGSTEDAALQSPASSDQLVDVKPRFDFTTELSGDGHYLFIRPSGQLRPGKRYRVHIHGDWLVGAAPGVDSGTVDTTLGFRTAPSHGKLPLRVRRKRTTAFSISRMAIPLPPLLPSVNQIGFDSYDMIAGTIARTKPRGRRAGRVLLWVIGARRDRHGVLEPDPAGNFQFPLAGVYRRDALSLSSADLSLQFSFGSVPLRLFELRGQIAPDLAMRPGTGIYSETTCSDVPNYSAQLQVAGVCNAQDTLAAGGTLLTGRYGDRAPARKPKGMGLSSLEINRPAGGSPGSVVARLKLARRARYPASRHIGSILLTGPGGEVVPLDYRGQTTSATDRRGDLREVRLTIPPGTSLPGAVRAYVILDVYPLAVRNLG